MNKKFKLVDVVNLVHPIPTERNAEAIKKLVEGDLRSFDTWEAELSKAGQVAESDEDKAELKKNAWATLVRTKKIKHMALLKNLRNIIEQAPEVVDEACALLTDEKSIKRSLVFPFRYYTAYEQIVKLPNSAASRAVLKALNKALDISCANVPNFGGETLLVLDVSGSMTEPCNYKSEMTPAKMGAVFCAVLAKSNGCDFMVFGDRAEYARLNPLDSTMTLIESIRNQNQSTDFGTIFPKANKRYDRVIIFSDMQGWSGNDRGLAATLAAYKSRFNANPMLYSFDLKNYGTMKFPESRVIALAGFSDKIFDIMKFMESDKRALINTINAYSFNQVKEEAAVAKPMKTAPAKKAGKKMKPKAAAKVAVKASVKAKPAKKKTAAKRK